MPTARRRVQISLRLGLRSTVEALIIDNRHSLFENPRTKSICRAKMPANRAAGVAIAMEHCSDFRQIGAYRATLHSRSHSDLSKECIKHSPSLPTLPDRRSVPGKKNVESITLKSAPRAHSSGSLRILPYSTFEKDSILKTFLERKHGLSTTFSCVILILRLRVLLLTLTVATEFTFWCVQHSPASQIVPIILTHLQTDVGHTMTKTKITKIHITIS